MWVGEEVHEQVWADGRNGFGGHGGVVVLVLVSLGRYVAYLVDVYQLTLVQAELRMDWVQPARKERDVTYLDKSHGDRLLER